MKMDAMSHQGQRVDLTCAQLGHKLPGEKTRDMLAADAGVSKNQVSRFIRLTELIPELLEMVDTKQIAFNPGVELSYLKDKEQLDFLEAMDYAQAAPSLSQAQRLKKLSQDGLCTFEAMCAVMGEEKKGDIDRVTFKTGDIKKYFPKSYTPKQMEDTIIKLLDQWQKKRERNMSL
jgi:ParB family chromosome partitioning protein